MDVIDYGFDRIPALKELKIGPDIATKENSHEYVVRAYAEHFYLWTSWSRKKEAMKAAKKAFDHYQALLGIERARQMGFEKYSEQPWEYVGWGVCLEANGGKEVRAP